MTSERLHILSRQGHPFVDRIEAGNMLGDVLVSFKGAQTVVVGIPRGGLVVARQAALRLQAPLDIILSRKLTAPENPELAIGAMTEEGHVFIDHDLVFRMGVKESYIEQEKEKQFSEINIRWDLYRRVCPKIDVKEKDVIIIDDGIATGSTVQAALWSIKQDKPRRLIGAFPVGPEETLQRLAQTADEIICLKVPPFLDSVGRYYSHFEPVSDEEVMHILRTSRE
jgi:putative phosphoribosyl transferase